MLIEQVIEFQLSEPGPPGRTFTLTTGYFHYQTKISKVYLRKDYFIAYCYDIAGGSVPHFSYRGQITHKI